MENNERIPFPQLPDDYRERYNDTPDWGQCPDCPDCGAVMGYNYFKDEFKCPDCGRLMEAFEAYELRAKEEEDEDEKPFVCRTCGGPWPECRTSCKMFDD